MGQVSQEEPAEGVVLMEPNGSLGANVILIKAGAIAQ
jgi:hypothetical protein